MGWWPIETTSVPSRGWQQRNTATSRLDSWLIPRHTGVFALGHVPATRESAWHAAVLALGAGAVLSHVAAAVLWGMVRRTAIIEVTVPTTAGHVKRDGILVHRQRLPPEHVTVRDGIPVTTPIRTLLDSDLRWPQWGLIVETDSAAFHSTAWARDRDARKDEAMGERGLRVRGVEVARSEA
jgi:hypothetical protein